MTGDIFSLMQDASRKFSKGQRAIYAYITQSYDKAAFMTAAKLGKTVGVSESTVVRFAVELGFDGYPAMQKAMQEMVLNRLTSVQRMEVANRSLADQDVLSTVIHSDMDKLRRTLETVSREDFSAAVDAILQGRAIYILGVRSAAPLASFLGYYLNYMFPNVHIVTASGTGEMFEKIVAITGDDVVIAFSFPRYSTATAKAAQYARDTGARVIAITDAKDSPLGRNADHVLLAKSDMLSLADSLVAPMSIINALIVALSSRREKEVTATFNTLEHIWEEYNVYEKKAGKA